MPSANGTNGNGVHALPAPKVETRGQPTLYRDEYPERLLEFFSGKRVERVVKRVRKITSKSGEVATELEYENQMTRFPMFEDFAADIGVCTSTLANWRKEHPAFLESYKRARDLQKAWLVELGLRGVAPAAAFIFTAKNVTDMRDLPPPLPLGHATFVFDPFKDHKDHQVSQLPDRADSSRLAIPAN